MKLHVYNLGWLHHMAEQHDLCAHGAGVYVRSLPKEPGNAYEAKAFAAFQAEWSRRRGRQFLRGSR